MAVKGTRRTQVLLKVGSLFGFVGFAKPSHPARFLLLRWASFSLLNHRVPLGKYMHIIKVLLVTALSLVTAQVEAITCPSVPDIASKNSDIHSDVKAALGSLGKAKIGDISVKTDVVAKSIFEKFPNVDQLIKIQMMSSIYCQGLNDAKSLSDSERLDRWDEFQRGILGIKTGSTTDAPKTKQTQEGSSTIELDGSYPKEKWRIAKKEDYSWLQDEWCYPSNQGLQSRFKIESGKLYRQQYGSSLSQPTHWIPIETIHLSNTSTLRLRYPKSEEWPVDFFQFEKENVHEFYEYTRGTNDDGTVVSNKKNLVLSCKHCKVSQDGAIYNCDKS